MRVVCYIPPPELDQADHDLDHPDHDNPDLNGK